jgi:predicted RNase H-like HicB family nuclease
MNFKVTLEQDEDGMYIATCSCFPGCISQGETEEEALKNIKEAIELHFRCLSEDGLPCQKDSKKKECIVWVDL